MKQSHKGLFRIQTVPSPPLRSVPPLGIFIAAGCSFSSQLCIYHNQTDDLSFFLDSFLLSFLESQSGKYLEEAREPVKAFMHWREKSEARIGTVTMELSQGQKLRQNHLI